MDIFRYSYCVAFAFQWCLHDGTKDTFKDLYGAGYATTIGPAQFRESKVNMINTEVAIKKFVKAGRPAKVNLFSRSLILDQP